MSILKELWYGNIYPCEKPVPRDSEYARALRKVIAEKERVLPALSPELQTQLDKLMDVQMEAAAIAGRDAFVHGFGLGMKIAVEAMSGN